MSHPRPRMLASLGLVTALVTGCAPDELATEAAPGVDAQPSRSETELLTFTKLGALSTTLTNADSIPRGYTVVNGAVLFFSAIRKGLWRTDGTSAGTTLVRDLEPTVDTFQRTPHMVTLNNKAYWSQANGLWTSDGTPAGTTRIAQFDQNMFMTPPAVLGNAIYFGANNVFYKSDGTTAGTQVVATARVFGSDDYWWQTLQVAGGKLYFPCDLSGAAAGAELCVSDGTTAGTLLVKDLRAGTASSDPRFIGRLGTKLVFSANVPSFRGLWITDGTSAGTIELLPPPTNGDAINQYEEDLAVIGTAAYLPCFTAATGYELCRTDGTVAGTTVMNLAAGTASGSPANFAMLGSRLFFVASAATSGRELWSSDGTVAGTALFKDMVPGTSDGLRFGDMLVAGTSLYFAAQSTIGESLELWKTDGTVAGTVQVKDILPSGKQQRYVPTVGVALGTKLIFTADDGVTGAEPWVTDGTAAGTVLLADMAPSASATTIYEAEAFAGAMYLAVNDTMGTNLWRSDGTAAGTGVFQTFNQQDAFGLTVVGNRLLYTGRSGGTNAVWTTDGTAPGTKVKDLPGSASEHVAVGTRLAFTGSTPNSSVGLWFSDGTAAGTNLTNPQVINARRLGVANGKAWLTGLDGVNGNELWTSDGTDAGTRRVKDIRVGNASSEPSSFAELGTQTIFTANDGLSGFELWKTDGTEAGTTRVADLRTGATGSGPFGMFAWKGSVLFWAASTSAYELWKTDGTTAGTTLVKAVAYAGRGTFVAWGDHVFFAATDGAGVELWRTDGTPAGTVMVKDLYAGPLSGNPTDLVVAGTTGPLFFVAEEPLTGRELWRLDDPLGTPELAADIAPGPRSSRPGSLTIQDYLLLLVADDGAGNAVYSLQFADPISGDGMPDPGGGDAGTDPGGGDGAGGCGCNTPGHASAWMVIVVGLVVLRRRRRATP